LIRGDGDSMAHQIKVHWHTTALARVYRLLRQMAPVIKKQGGDSFVDFVSTAAIRQ
jgi:DNA-binding transcriptional regulator YhcF (GntR family)